MLQCEIERDTARNEWCSLCKQKKKKKTKTYLDENERYNFGDKECSRRGEGRRKAQGVRIQVAHSLYLCWDCGIADGISYMRKCSFP